jgi:hypothetical protein
MAACPVPGNIRHYARDVMRTAARRTIDTCAVALAQAATLDDYDDMLSRAGDVVGTVDRIMSRPDPAELEPLANLSTVDEFVTATDEPYDWIIPGVLERMDRVIVVASEGAGKSTLSRQIATQTAAGVHPWSPRHAIPAHRTLVVDLENPPALVRRKTRALYNVAAGMPTWRKGNMFVWVRPSGLNIRRPSDAALLDRVIGEVRPALVCLGPLYKSFLDNGDRPEQVASEAAAVLDQLREKHQIAWWLEHHAPLEQNGTRNLRPFGSALWSRWPEFGIALRKDRDRDRMLPPAVLVEAFRGHRDERIWPDGLERATPWPWAPLFDDGPPPELEQAYTLGRTA